MKRNAPDPLLNAVFDEEHLEACRQATLESGLASLRRLRSRRRAWRACLTVSLLAVAAFVVAHSLRHSLEPTTRRIASHPPATESSPGIKVISDDELFALFPNRPVALIGTPGHQQLVFLDQVNRSQPVLGN